MNNSKKYFNSVDINFDKLLRNGSIKLPSLKTFNLNLDEIAENISSEMNSMTFKENGVNHKKLISQLGINDFLADKLYSFACKYFDYRGRLDNQYHIARRVEPGNKKEIFRAHFDSHLFTLVIPIKIPYSKNGNNVGELVYFPNIRNFPKSELNNIFEKTLYKKYASLHGVKKLSKIHNLKIDNFLDYKPLLFFGKTTLHCNYPVSVDCDHYRLTLLCHFFDDKPKYGIGSILRFIRGR